MKPDLREVTAENLATSVKSWTSGRQDGRLGLLTSIDGRQLVSLVLDPHAGRAECWTTPLSGDSFRSLTNIAPQAHWFERTLFDMFGLRAEGHPRLKHMLLHDEYDSDFHPLSWRETENHKNDSNHEHAQPLARSNDSGSVEISSKVGAKREYQFLEVRGEGVYELPVGPIHAGVIEPGHFRFNCFGETIVNLELRLGFVHRGVEKRMTEVPWQKARFVAEAAASDTASANAIAHATAIESIFDVEVPLLALKLRTLALEIERLAIHIIDVGGMGTDTGFLAVSAGCGRLRGKALAMGQALSGSRFLRAFTMPGGVMKIDPKNIQWIKKTSAELREELRPLLEILRVNQSARERMQTIGKLSTSLAQEFGMVGIVARGCGINYDTRQFFPHCSYPTDAPPPVVETGGDILARLRVRLGEIKTSFDVIDRISAELLEGDLLKGPTSIKLPENLPANRVGLGIVEAFRGELIHLVFTDQAGKLQRYAIKDPSVNNWTTVSIAIRNNLIADFPLCNKSLALSYSGNDL
jgi:Ni,Fe-hydrogenase III large subunit/Ni,Fe-hydrogenase III component G